MYIPPINILIHRYTIYTELYSQTSLEMIEIKYLVFFSCYAPYNTILLLAPFKTGVWNEWYIHLISIPNCDNSQVNSPIEKCDLVKSDVDHNTFGKRDENLSWEPTEKHHVFIMTNV